LPNRLDLFQKGECAILLSYIRGGISESTLLQGKESFVSTTIAEIALKVARLQHSPLYYGAFGALREDTNIYDHRHYSLLCQMPPIKSEIDGHTIVLVGSLNPQIFQPAWFSSQNLLKKDEAEGANIEIISRELVIFSTGWLRIEVFPERVVFATAQTQAFEWLRDLALGTFKVLHHTPINKLGINRDIHFRIETEEKWHAIGHRLAPKEVWKDLLKSPGMAGLTMRGSRPDEHKGALNVRVEPSTKVKPGVFINVNDHYEQDSPEVSPGADKMLELLEASWATSLARSLTIAETIAGLQ
jgi:hypothetical protein